MDNLKQLKNKRRAFTAQLTSFEKFISSYDNENITNIDYETVLSRLNKLTVKAEQFDEVQTEIEAQIEDIDEELHVRIELEERIHNLIGSANSFLNIHKPKLIENRNNTVENVKLPIIEIPSFDGELTKWRQFIDSFCALIHNNNSLSCIQKFCYLKSALSGDALNLIGSLETTSSNYQIAYDLLNDRFDHRRRIIYSHANDIIHIKHKTLKDLANLLEQYLRSLEALGVITKDWNAFLVPYIVSKLDSRFIREWESHVNSKFKVHELPSCAQLITFLLEKSYTLDAPKDYQAHFTNNRTKTQGKHSSYVVNNRESCLYCNGEHKIYTCKGFIAITANDKLKFARDTKLCINCLKPGHVIKECTSSKCKECKQPHHSLLHFKRNVYDSTKTPEVTTVSNCSTLQINSQTLLSTAEIMVVDTKGNKHPARALLDSGSQTNFVTEEFCRKLSLEKHTYHSSVSGVSQVTSKISACTTLNFASVDKQYNSSISCLVLSKITENLPQVSFSKRNIQIPAFVNLADNKFNQSKEIDVLIGSTTFWELIENDRVELKHTNLSLRKTKLGWVVSGFIPLSNVCINNVAMTSLHDQLRNFWKLEEVNELGSQLSPEETICELNFEKTTKRDETGRFVVTLPLTDNVNKLGESRHYAIKRFNALENRLKKDENVKQMYTEFIEEYIKLGHMTEISDKTTELEYFLPHHHVLREESITTKLRVVFDGSAKTSSKLSLNNVQYVGKIPQSDLFSILIRFRTHRFIAIADIEKMYRQILISPEQRNLQKIVWRGDEYDRLRHFQLNTVTYGTAAAPYLATRCLHQLGLESQLDFPEPSRMIINDMYVDDLLTGNNNRDELINNCKNVSEILKTASFNLRKWKFNFCCPNNEFDLASNNSPLELAEEITKTLGISYNNRNDMFQFKLNSIESKQKLTKRTIVSNTAQLYDPLGFLSPITIVPKLIIQILWKEHIDWDESVPLRIENKWKNYTEGLEMINEIKIPRHVMGKSAKEIELHGFADASQVAYGACVYVRTRDENDKYDVKLLTAKSRVAPLKTITIPRLELCAAHLLSKLVKRVRKIMNLEIHRLYLWSDSVIVLSWINGSPSNWKTFISNRVVEIQEATNIKDWYHVRSAYNPADLISRGVLTQELIDCKLWWHGPDWLLKNTVFEPFRVPKLDIPEQKQTISLVTYQLDCNLIDKYSNLTRLVNVVAYIRRFLHNCRQRNDHYHGELSVIERENSLIQLIKQVQRECYANEFDCMQRNKPIDLNSKILSLAPFLDKDGIIRVGGRLKHSNLEYNQKHQILLPSHKLTQLIATHEHKQLLHCGSSQLLNSLRQNYWPTHGKNLARAITHKCTTCFKLNAKVYTQKMGDLPSVRVTESAPFSHVGIDYLGPFKGRERRARGYKTFKTYVCIFICMATKAIHLEIVSDLTTKAFLASLKRFISRRGKPICIYSDNGTNFVGANAELNNSFKNLLVDSTKPLANDGIEINWQFIPPRSPHHGGLWESHVKLVKRHLIKSASDVSLTWEEFSTILNQIEGIINSRPLSPLSNDPNDLNPLTPAHFLIGRPITAIPERILLDINEGKLEKFEKLQKVVQQFWYRWKTEYLHNLQQRQKWKSPNKIHLKEGSLVILREDNEPPTMWQLGRLEKLWCGADGHVRVVTVKTKTGSYKRPVNKICVLPVD